MDTEGRWSGEEEASLPGRATEHGSCQVTWLQWAPVRRQAGGSIQSGSFPCSSTTAWNGRSLTRGHAMLFSTPRGQAEIQLFLPLILLLKVGAKHPNLELFSRLKTQLGKEETGKIQIESEPQRLGTPEQSKSLSHGAPVLEKSQHVCNTPSMWPVQN